MSEYLQIQRFAGFFCDSEAHGSLTFSTSHIKILAFAKDHEHTPQVSKGAKASSEKEPDDLPF